MTVSTQVSRNEYTGNGATTQYDFTFRILDKSHLLVQTLDNSESIVTLTLGTDYTVTGVNRYNGGKVVLTSALPAGYKISIERSTPVTQEASIRNQGGFFPEIHEDALDKLTMLVQQAYGWWSGLSLRKPSWLANYYDALNNRIRNLRDPSQAQDAATKNYVDNSVAGSNSHADNLFTRTIRVPESSISQFTSVTGRRNSLLGFDSNGDPVPIFSMTDTADLAIKLASHDKNLGATLVSLYGSGNVQNAILYATPQMFGAVGGTTTVDNTQPIQDMLAFAKLFGFGVDLRGGPWRITQTADFTGIYSVISDWSGRFLVDSNNFTAAHAANYAVTFGDPDGDAYTGRAAYVCVTGTIGIVSDNRDVELNGVYFKGSHFDVGYVRVNGLNGSGIMLSAVWDSSFTRLSAQDSGNINNYQVGIVSGGDTSNCIKIGGIQSENAYHKCLIIGCIRSEIGNIHAERTSVLTTDDGTTGLQSTLTYTNVLINVGNTSIGQIIHDCRTTGTAPDGTALAATNSSVVVNLDYTSSIKDASFSGSIGNTMFGRNSTYGQMSFLDWYFGGSNVSNLTFIGPRCIGTLHPNKKTKFINGTYNAVIPLFGAADLDFDNCDIASLTFPNNIVGNISFRKSRFPAELTLGDTKQPTGFTGDSTLGETKRPVFFDDCEFLGAVAGAYRARAIFRGCMIATVALASRAAFNFKDCKITAFSYTGDRAFTTERCAVTAVSSWGVPNQIIYPIGTVTERPGEDTASAGVLFRCASQTAVSWAKLI